MDDKMRNFGSGNPGSSSENPSTSTNLVRLNIIDMREGVENNMMDSGQPNVKITSIDSGIETGNDSNDSAIVPIETRQLSVISDDILRRTSLDTYKKWGLEMQEIFQPFSSMSSDAIEAACSGAKTYQLSSSIWSTKTNERHIFLEDWKQLMRTPLKRQLTYKIGSSFRSRPETGGRFAPSAAERRISQYAKEFDERRLRVAASTNNVGLVERLLDQGVDPNSSDSQLRTSLHLSSGRGYTEIVRLLLRYGANPSLKDCIGNTPLHLAAVTSKISVVTLLLEAGCDPLSSDNHGYNPLQLAETKLRLLQNCKGDDMLRIKSEVHEVVNMLVAYLKNRDGFRDQVDVLSSFCSRLSLSNTSNQVQDEVRDLLCNIDSLSLKS